MNAQLRMIVAMLLFGSMGLLVRNIHLPSSTIALTRSIIGVLFLVLISIFLKKHISSREILKNGFLLLSAGIMLSANWIFIFEAYRHTTIATATLSYYLAPIFVTLLSPFILKEQLTTIKCLCIAASLLGMILVSGVVTNPVQDTADFIGVGYGLAAAVSYASLTILNKFIKKLSSIEATISQLGISSIILLPYVLLTSDLGTTTLEIQAIILLIILGVVHTGLAFGLYFSSLQNLKAQTVAAFSYIDPVTAILLSALLLNEQMGFVEMFGAVLILGSTLIGERLL